MSLGIHSEVDKQRSREPLKSWVRAPRQFANNIRHFLGNLIQD
jgi:hypothetical protein